VIFSFRLCPCAAEDIHTNDNCPSHNATPSNCVFQKKTSAGRHLAGRTPRPQRANKRLALQAPSGLEIRPPSTLKQTATSLPPLFLSQLVRRRSSDAVVCRPSAHKSKRAQATTSSKPQPRVACRVYTLPKQLITVVGLSRVGPLRISPAHTQAVYYTMFHETFQRAHHPRLPLF
jgi:hypothetical protein